MLAVSVIGFSIFYLLPFLLSFAYVMIDNPIHARFVGWGNFKELFQNKYFLLGLKNTLQFMLLSIPLNMLLSLLLALTLHRDGRRQKYMVPVFLIPLVIPSATTAFFWEKLFHEYGPVNQFLHHFQLSGGNWYQSEYGMAIMLLIFLWKNIGYNMLLFLSGLHNIPEEYYEFAILEGAGRWQRFGWITRVYLQPTLLLVFIMTFVNSFKVFKEIYLITGETPHESLYILQHYMNNMFLGLNYSKLTAASYVVTTAVVVIVAVVFHLERRLLREFQ